MAASSGSLCDACKRTHVSWLCKDCSSSFCNDCNDNHSKCKLFRDHLCVELQQRNTCALHSGQLHLHYCKLCQEFACRLCVVASHTEHEEDIVGVQAFVDGRKANIQAAATVLEINVGRLNEVQEELTVTLVERLKEAIAEIKEHAKNTVTLIREEEDRLIGKARVRIYFELYVFRGIILKKMVHIIILPLR